MSDDDPEAWRKSCDEFHMVMGYCIAAWAGVNDQLFNIFRDCVGPLDQCSVIYYRTPGLDARLSLTAEIVRTTLVPSWERPGNADPRMKEWNAIAAQFRRLLAVRRRIAHHPVRTEPLRVGMPVGIPLTEFEIYVGRHEELRESAAKLPAPSD